ncbi:MAG: TrkA family potassium uptake protein [Deltaproteobacteria bacterium]|nr:TrkA family potassium uptake protein [Deltaproteobacteria bacterium]
MKDSRYFVVVGCGRLGSLLANHLSRRGHDVVVIDRRPAAFANLSAEFSGFQVLGDAVEPGTLRQAGTEKADCLLAVAEEDNVNLMVAQVAEQVFGVRTILARVNDPARESAFRHLGVATVNPTLLTAEALLSQVAAENPGGES